MSILPNHIPLFPLGGTILLPAGDLPLNIFEPRYISMVNYALKNNRLIGMIQPRSKRSYEIYKIGCVGKITSFKETSDKRYLINLKGLSRFSVLNELEKNNSFRIFNVNYNLPNSNFNKFNKKLFERKLFIEKVQLYFKNLGLFFDSESLNKIDDISLIIMISMICPFNVNEKQSLLESKNIDLLAQTIMTLIEFSLNENLNHESIN